MGNEVPGFAQISAGLATSILVIERERERNKKKKETEKERGTRSVNGEIVL